MHVLLLSPHAPFARAIAWGLREESIAVTVVSSRPVAEAVLQAGTSDAIIIDFDPPVGHGLTLLSKWREQGVSIPALVIVHLEDGGKKVGADKWGLHDTVTKPFEMSNLLERLQALLGLARRTQGTDGPRSSDAGD